MKKYFLLSLIFFTTSSIWSMESLIRSEASKKTPERSVQEINGHLVITIPQEEYNQLAALKIQKTYRAYIAYKVAKQWHCVMELIKDLEEAIMQERAARQARQ